MSKRTKIKPIKKSFLYSKPLPDKISGGDFSGNGIEFLDGLQKVGERISEEQTNRYNRMIKLCKIDKISDNQKPDLFLRKIGREHIKGIIKYCKSNKTDPIVELVIKKFRDRSQVGIKKYGTTLAENTKDDMLVMLQEELMDGVNYIEAELNRRLKPDNNIICNQMKKTTTKKSLTAKKPTTKKAVKKPLAKKKAKK